MAEWQQGKK